ncbi:hypothetical protein C8J57DRAFT_1229968 [Mycena rebaudengoi]|nr:hypothetical protein C8J57DRAFT_1229968 [Mycena rebaudengoi]
MSESITIIFTPSFRFPCRTKFWCSVYEFPDGFTLSESASSLPYARKAPPTQHRPHLILATRAGNAEDAVGKHNVGALIGPPFPSYLMAGAHGEEDEEALGTSTTMQGSVLAQDRSPWFLASVPHFAGLLARATARAIHRRASPWTSTMKAYNFERRTKHKDLEARSVTPPTTTRPSTPLAPNDGVPPPRGPRAALRVLRHRSRRAGLRST